MKFTQHGLQTMKDQSVERAEMVKKNAQALGGKLLQAYYCLSGYDVV
ncbi:MAG: GYD domain-containing protein, partial [Nitrospira sp.]|nr:GYD domain-containing protein [Nitrospira sp.]